MGEVTTAGWHKVHADPLNEGHHELGEQHELDPLVQVVHESQRECRPVRED